MEYMLLIVSSIIIYNNKETINIRNYLIPTIFIGLVGGLVNAVAISSLYDLQISFISYLLAGLSMVLTLFAGIIMANKANLPLYWSKNKSHPKSKLLLIGVVVGLLLGYLNLQLTIYSISNSNLVPAFIEYLYSSSNRFFLSTLLSIQAGIVEEVIFRMFIISGSFLIIKKALPNLCKKSLLVISVLISAFAFGFIPAHNLILGILFGIFLGFSYAFFGLIPMITMHIVGNLLFLNLVINHIEKTGLL